ncbi:MAG: hypothetical protein C4534_06570 [Gaiellales bacterium]|nr:MAG: hypothetical protein C4534_06570 [Gaiellales bacterium]
MQVKIFEVRGPGTCYPVMVIRLRSRNKAESWLLSTSGYGAIPAEQEVYFLMCALDPGSSANYLMDGMAEDCLLMTYSPDTWDLKSNDILREAHRHIENNWGKLASGDVIDTEFIAGRTQQKKVTDRPWNWL